MVGATLLIIPGTRAGTIPGTSVGMIPGTSAMDGIAHGVGTHLGIMDITLRGITDIIALGITATGIRPTGVEAGTTGTGTTALPAGLDLTVIELAAIPQATGCMISAM